jgi:hypothetical protein
MSGVADQTSLALRAPIVWLVIFLCCMAEWALLDVGLLTLVAIWLASAILAAWSLGALIETLYRRGIRARSTEGHSGRR